MIDFPSGFLKIKKLPRVTINTAGFSLIEILVVIALISALLILALPTFNKVLEVHKESVCSSHLREVSTVLFIYTGEHNGMLPPGRFGTTVSNWFSIIAVGMTDSGGYLETPPGRIPFSLLQCPSEESGYSWTPWRNVGYTYNSRAGNSLISTNPNPSQTPIVWDGTGLYASGYYGWSDFLRFSNPRRHQGRMNILMLDGHIERRGESELRNASTNQMKSGLIWSW